MKESVEIEISIVHHTHKSEAERNEPTNASGYKKGKGTVEIQTNQQEDFLLNDYIIVIKLAMKSNNKCEAFSMWC